MAYSVAQRVISKKDSIYDYCDDLSRKSKLLYNASLFRIRNIFTGYEKEHLTSNEAEVFGEVKLLHESYPVFSFFSIAAAIISYVCVKLLLR